MLLEFEVIDQILKRTDNNKPLSNSQGFLKAFFKIPPEYTGNITAHFKAKHEGYMVEEPIPVINGICSVPSNMIKSGDLFVWVSISTNESYIPTCCEKITIGDSGDTGSILPLPNSYINQYEEIKRMHAEILHYSNSEGDAVIGINGKSIEFTWSGTSLGVRQEGQSTYQYVNLQGTKGEIGDTSQIQSAIASLLTRIKALEGATSTIPTEPDPAPITGSIPVTNYGADASGVNYSTVAFKNALSVAKSEGKKVYVPAGTYKLKWWGEDWAEAADEMNPSLLVGNFEGVGDIIIDKFPQPGNRDTGFNVQLISSKYENCFGKFNMRDIDNPMIMDMHLTHEARSNMDMYHVNFGPVKRHYEPATSGATRPRWNCWAQIALRYDKKNATLPSGNVLVNIGKIGLLIYNQGKWSIHSNPYAQDGGMFDVRFNTFGTTSGTTRTVKDGYVQYSIPWSLLKQYLLHFWSPEWRVPNNTTVQYMVGFTECWLDPSNAQYADYLCFNTGIDMVAENNPDGSFPTHDEFATGRFLKLGTSRRFEYIHNVRYFETESVLKNAGLHEMIANKTITIYG